MNTVTGQNRMTIEMNPDVQAVIEFMQATVEASRLVGVAESIPQIARLLWSDGLQEPCYPIALVLPKPTGCDPSLLGAIV